jgi:hypothetical protein
MKPREGGRAQNSHYGRGSARLGHPDKPGRVCMCLRARQDGCISTHIQDMKTSHDEARRTHTPIHLCSHMPVKAIYSGCSGWMGMRPAISNYNNVHTRKIVVKSGSLDKTSSSLFIAVKSAHTRRKCRVNRCNEYKRAMLATQLYVCAG